MAIWEMSASSSTPLRKEDSAALRTILPSRPMSSKDADDSPSPESTRESRSVYKEGRSPVPGSGTKEASSKRRGSNQHEGDDTDREVGDSAPSQGGQICRYGAAWLVRFSGDDIDICPRSNCKTTRTPLWRRSPQGATICNACGLYQKARNASRPTNLKRPPSVVASSSSVRDTLDRASPKPSGGSAPKSPGATYVAADQMPTGTCPGGGRCNGTGGADGCSGCPAYNNRLAKSASLGLLQKRGSPSPAKAQAEGSSSAAPEPVDVNALQQQGQNTTVIIACQNCGTTITPLWRRDEAGHTICNACGKFCAPHLLGSHLT
jgi:hypothetical protein